MTHTDTVYGLTKQIQIHAISRFNSRVLITHQGVHVCSGQVERGLVYPQSGWSLFTNMTDHSPLAVALETFPVHHVECCSRWFTLCYDVTSWFQLLMSSNLSTKYVASLNKISVIIVSTSFSFFCQGVGEFISQVLYF